MQWCRRSALHTKAMHAPLKNWSSISDDLLEYAQKISSEMEIWEEIEEGMRKEIHRSDIEEDGLDLLDGPLAEVKWAYTRLTLDRMAPMSQVVGPCTNIIFFLLIDHELHFLHELFELSLFIVFV